MLHKLINIRLSQTHLAVYRKGGATFGIKIFNTKSHRKNQQDAIV